MFAFFRKPKARKPARRRSPLRFVGEQLEDRCCPSAMSVFFEAQVADGKNVQLQGTVFGSDSSYQVALSGPVGATVTTDPWGNFGYYGPASGLGTITATVTDSDGDTATGASDIYDPGPQVDMFQANAGGQGNQVFISGSVSANDPDGLTVTFSGAGVGAGSATTDSDGNFSVLTSAQQLGEITATVTDVWGVTSSPTTTSIMCMPPEITNLTVEATGQGKQVTVTGSVSASSPEGLKVNFSGAAGLGATSATTDADGNFSVTTTASQPGEVDASVTDVWGETASTTTVFWVMPPEIQGFGAIQLPHGEWKFEGTIIGPDAAHDSVQLSGLSSTTATPDANGYFSVIVYLGDNPTGTEYAVATDIWGQQGPQESYSYYG